jgi:very-short-patch-repair endonuclease
VLDELTELRKNRPDLEPFFREDRPEPFFVKNLENVQGDERDRIILNVAYGLNAETGRDSMSFGPLNRAGGERRLNVAVTRSREAITLVSSIRSDYIDLNRTKARGARPLRAYLDYAERGPSALMSESVETGGDFESQFEEAVAQAIIKLGFDVRTQIGCSGFRIDLAIVHPEHPGRYVLVIECDGATYHRTATARDRDRIRQEVLEELGWRGRLIRIWSTDWIRNPTHQIERVANAFRESLLLPVTSPAAVTSPMGGPEVSPPSPEAEPDLSDQGLSGHRTNTAFHEYRRRSRWRNCTSPLAPHPGSVRHREKT